MRLEGDFVFEPLLFEIGL